MTTLTEVLGVPCRSARIDARQAVKTNRRKAATAKSLSVTVAGAALSVSLGFAAFAALIMAVL